GGLDRIFHDLLLFLPRVGVDSAGLVLGPLSAGAATGGRVVAFGRGGASLPERLWRARKAISTSLRSGSFDAVAAHFAMYAAPALDRLHCRPLIVHFHGPWAEESATEGDGRLS